VLLVLGEDDLAVADDVELARVAGGGRRLDPGLLQLCDETRRTFVVAASGRAIEDLDGHRP
jgi:hypothetical protein